MSALDDREDDPPNIPPPPAVPREAESRATTEPAADPIQALLLRLLDEQNAGFSLVFERIGELRGDVQKLREEQQEIRDEQKRQARVQEAFAIHVDKRLDDIEESARDSGNGSLVVSDAINKLREGLEQQVRHEVEKVLDAHLPIQRLAAAVE